MATKTKAKSKPGTQLDRETLLGYYRTMLLSRRLDDKEIQLKRQNKIFFQISGAGHEAIQVAAAAHARPGYDWFYFYYRDRAFSLALGMTPLEHMLQAVGAEADPASGGRQMPAHWGRRDLNIVSTSSPTGTQFLQAVGNGGGRGARAASCGDGQLKEITDAKGDEVVFVTTGDGTTSEGEFWEALNTRLQPEAAGGLHRGGQRLRHLGAGGGEHRRRQHLTLVTGFPDLLIEECDGTDIVESLRDDGARGGATPGSAKGPALVHAHVIRPYSHSLSDDERFYKTEAMRSEEALRDPLVRRGGAARGEHGVTEEELERMDEEVKRGGDRGRRRGARIAAAGPLHRHALPLLAGRRSDRRAVRHRGRPALPGQRDHHGGSHQRDA